MRNLILITTLLFCSLTNAQQYLEKQSTQVINKLSNAGYENGLTGWTRSVSSTASVSTTAPIQDSSSLVFTSTASGQTVTSPLVDLPLVGDCQAELRYKTSENTNKYLWRVLDGSSNVLSSVVLEPVTNATTSRVYFSCTGQAKSELRATGSAVSLKADSNYIGSKKDLVKIDITGLLGYEPVATVSVASPLSITGGASNPVIALQNSGVTSGGTYPKVTVDGYGRVVSGNVLINSDLPDSGVAAATYPKVTVNSKGVVTSGSALVNNDLPSSGANAGTYTKVTVNTKGVITNGTDLTDLDIPSLDASKIATGTLPVSRGGTGFSTFTTGDQVVASGSSLVKVPIGTVGKVWTVGASNLPEWGAASAGGGGESGVNLITNNSFETDVTTGWTASGVTVTRTAYTNGTSSNSYFASMTATVSGAYFETSSLTIPDNLRGSDLEFGSYHTNLTGAWRAEYFVSGTVVASQTLASSTTWIQDPIAVTGTASNQTTTKVRFTSLTSGIATLGLDLVYAGSKKSFVNGAIVGPAQTQTGITIGAITTPPTKGTTSKDKIVWRRFGSYLEAEYYFEQTAGSAGSGEYLFTLPNGLKADTSLVTAYTGAAGTSMVTSKIGYGDQWSTTGPNKGNNYPVLYDETRFRLAGALYWNGSATQFFFNSAATFNLSEAVGYYVYVRVPIQGWAGSGVSFDGRCPNDISCTNEFTAMIDSSGNVEAGSQTPFEWINTSGSPDCPDSSGFGCTYLTGIFTVAPQCDVQNADPGQSTSAGALGSSTLLRWQYSNNNKYRSLIRCRKIAPDFVSKYNSTGYLSQTMTTSGENLSRVEYGTVFGASITSSCTSTPCGFLWKSTAGVTATRSSTGTYALNFPVGTFGGPISCTFSATEYGVSNNRTCSIQPSTSTTAANLTCQNATNGASTDVQFSYTCSGARP